MGTNTIGCHFVNNLQRNVEILESTLPAIRRKAGMHIARPELTPAAICNHLFRQRHFYAAVIQMDKQTDGRTDGQTTRHTYENVQVDGQSWNQH